MILDEFIIKLGLDPREFDQAQRTAFDRLRTLETGATRSSDRIAEAMRGGMYAFYKEFNKGLGEADVRMSHVGDASRRTGEKVAAAGTQASMGFKGLTASLLEAYAVVGTLEGAFRKLEQAAGRGTRLALGSEMTGIPIRTLDAMVKMVPLASQAQMQGVIAQASQFYSNMLLTGQFPLQLTRLSIGAGMARVPFDMPRALKDPQYYLEAINKILHALSLQGPEGRRYASALGGQLGLTPEIIHEYEKSPEAFARDYRTARARTIGADTSRELLALSSSAKKAGQALDTVSEEVLSFISKSGLRSFLDLISKPEGMKTFGIQSGVAASIAAAVGGIIGGPFGALGGAIIGIAIGAILTGAEAKLDQLMGKGSPRDRAWNDALGTWQREHGTGKDPRSFQQFKSDFDKLYPPGAAYAPIPPAAGALGPQSGGVPYGAPERTVGPGGNWEMQHNNFAGIRRRGIKAGPNAGGFMSYRTPEEGVQAIGELLQVYQDKHGLNTLRGIISRWAPPIENDTAGLIARAAKFTGFAPDQPLNLHDRATLTAMVRAMIAGEQGGRIPVSSKIIAAGVDALVPATRVAGGDVPAYQHGGIVGVHHAGEAILPRYLTDFLLASARISAPMLAGLSYGRSATGGSSVNSAVDIGQLHVHTAATDAAGIARALPAALRREMAARTSRRVMAANTVFE